MTRIGLSLVTMRSASGSPSARGLGKPVGVQPQRGQHGQVGVDRVGLALALAPFVGGLLTLDHDQTGGRQRLGQPYPVAAALERHRQPRPAAATQNHRSDAHRSVGHWQQRRSTVDLGVAGVGSDSLSRRRHRARRRALARAGQALLGRGGRRNPGSAVDVAGWSTDLGFDVRRRGLGWVRGVYLGGGSVLVRRLSGRVGRCVVAGRGGAWRGCRVVAW
jgi:hypothetical protein